MKFLTKELSQKKQRELRSLINKAEGYLLYAKIIALDSGLKEEITSAIEHTTQVKDKLNSSS